MGIIFHIDANSAYLSWTAVKLLQHGYHQDIRQCNAVIAGDPANRHGIILAKSLSAKRHGIHTGDSLFQARQKCPDLLVFPPDYNLYMDCSEAMFQLLNEYSDLVQRYSIDECFLDYSQSRLYHGDPVTAACQLKNRIHQELGFTVNIGIGPNKLLAKMAGELQKPDMVHTLWTEEIEKKMWPLPVEELFMCGRASARKLRAININSIGDLAKTDPVHLKALLKSHGLLLWNYANGVCDEKVTLNAEIQQKGVSNSITTKRDLTTPAEAEMVLLALTERTGLRLRKLGCVTDLVGISLRTSSFTNAGHQRKLPCTTDSTSEIYGIASQLLQESWKGDPLRQLGVSVSHLSSKRDQQLSMFQEDTQREERIDQTVDAIRRRFGDTAIFRGTFANRNIPPIQGGVNDGNYIMMGGYGQ